MPSRRSWRAADAAAAPSHALQDKVWVHGPGQEPWEVYTVKADAPHATSVRPDNESGTSDCGTPAAADGSQIAACC